ncbi:ZZ-type zinc finger-containing protein 3 isoform X1 [Erinaceus europaeus]|uniref:ZZ-type zinc finger-containing protein 3 isoform X1 n=1 Tax=Erinaceus europaeus TaxID=9365 RepID=A0A1S3WQ36_ERIEU|nr:ZZ-type zinc finger-containing protein 3 isoform X1 [Erinaceus europaeus]XP_060058187.1 ZZ-type zinc finger-containing protein 3 isoform X1 [Erinaceus europaeus]XP_060058188.1 ZZ-type zinc finger-containing protein 3 isoform X1 [Erinaceus europaeus]XP_060058189.1 ZZ-type zinc finger-containing protein 3 isoform X1 [Erinaceus europaeus]XP_060058190.1 ZZ-type zinc finger-containing protein 3 isoform X1 [Erinaceus europaeus]
MAASRSTRVTRSTVGLNGLDESFCGRTLRNRSIAHPEEISSHSQVRSRSPKKRPEPVQIHKGSNNGRTTDLKQQSTRESWVSPRKRGLSSSEKDNLERQAIENCERRQTEPVSPVLKRIKRCLRSEAPNSSEEDSPIKSNKESVEQRSSVVDNDADIQGTKRACRCLILDDCEKREIKKVNISEEESLNSAVVEEITGYLTVNGDSPVVNCDDCQPDGNTKQNSTGSCVLQEKSVAENGDSDTHTSKFLDSRKEDGYVDHNVPCTNSEVQVKLEDHKAVTACLPVEHANQLATAPAAGHFSESQSSVRDSEEEVDVVGDSASKEQCNENTSDSLDTCLNSMPVSGETELSSVLDCTSAQTMSLSEPQEHRYTLRISPRRAPPTRGSPSKHSSPCRENGQLEENNLSSNETSAVVSDNVSESVTDPDEISQNEKRVCCDSENYGIEGLNKPSTEARLNVGHLPPAKESANLHITEEEDDDPDVYYFESDHVALKHNKDYQRLLQTIAVLEAQRSQAVQDLESLGRYQREALKNPIGFVEKLQKKADIGLPYPQRVVQLPEIVWDQYTNSLGNFEREFKNRKRHSRRVKLVFDKVGLPARPKSPLDSKKDGESLSYSVLPLSDGPEGSNSRPQMIRGRLCDDTKPETFNQLWTVEEQKKLEQLLLKYPPEEVESRRWQKIADELGNRTAKQVASRVQKYFIKLTKAGIPVPGRTPNLYIYSKKSSTSRRQHPLNKHLFKPSTFMTSHEPPVYMDEDDDRPCFHSHMNTTMEEASDEESIPVMCRNLPEYKELLQFKKLKKQKLQQMQAEGGFVQHIGFKCDNCGIEPIQGIRWHCQDCPPEMSLDFCDSCSDCLHETDIHKEDHQLEPVYRSETFLDRDYCVSQGTSYNYLDPNYFPANR